jgi:2-polyprenyl-6-methoxyphenol hydroxylase-like FAD-dependent oxidoreductase
MRQVVTFVSRLTSATIASIEYSCIFGMSEMKEGFPRNTSVNGQGYGYAHLVMDGPDDTVFWFLFAQDTEKRRGLWESIPRYTDAEKDALAAKHADDKVTDTLTFGDLYRTQKMSTLQAVPEAVFEQWHNGRIITIGDAAHKVLQPYSRTEHRLTLLI